MAAETIEKQSTIRKPAPMYRVLLHNDPVNTMEYVIQCLIEVLPSLSQPQAMNIMMETHNNGIGLVTICAFEPAEFYCESLRNKGLTSTIEPDE
ncbi:ATP-dependent Clp protease adapter ClpS [filamentous cyanobacterium LEGE 11480]|uniref:ATP-dependent Clp protease adapter protein ClpS n=1 Tax=Romeriopsis navalis LEGE 11480 TaxID=2777977 RepID=A0A928VVR2_9CYAN|nr:ATP-dependent Clp protease adapter ClpS [Romeriopsis navalis]MBE9033367.1 ATP-dependent Clp protease adapter ClpS [Romeriopsis navalis LEGE 11480]